MPDQLPWLAGLVRGPAGPARFVRLAAPQTYAIVAIRMGEYVTHLGVVLSPQEFLHATDAGPRVERIEAWAPRIEGFYEFAYPALPPGREESGAVPGSLTILTNPLTGATRAAAGPAAGRSIAEWLAQEGVPAAACLLNGEPLGPKEWSYRPRPGDRVQVIVLVGKDTQMMGMILMVMLAVVSYGVGGYVGGAAGLGWGQGWGAAAAAGIMIGGSLLLNTLLAPGAPDAAQARQAQWSDQTIQAQGGAVPKIYGDVRVHGNIIGHYSELGAVTTRGLQPAWWIAIEEGWRQFFNLTNPELNTPITATPVKLSTQHLRNVLICFGEGPIGSFDVSSLRINDQSITDLAGVAVEYRNGTLEQTAMSKFNTETPIEFFAGYVLPYDTNVRTYTLPGTGYDDAEVTVVYTNGIWSMDQSELVPQRVVLKVEVGDAVGNTWQTLFAGFVWGETTNPLRVVYRASTTYEGGAPLAITRAMQPRFRVTRIEPSYQGTTWGGDCMIGEVRGILNEVFEHPGKVLMQISALPSDLLSGSLDVSIVVHGSILQRWDAAANPPAWVLDAVKPQNPAWIDYDILTYPLISGDGIGTPYAVEEYRGVDPDTIDLTGFLATEVLADGQVPDGLGGAGLENRIEIDTVFGETGNVYDAVRRIGVTGRAGLDLRGNQVGLWCDDARVPCGLFGDGNWLKDSWEPDPIPQADRAAELEIVYYDQDNGDEQTPILVPDLEIETTNRSAIDCRGTRRRSEAWRTGRYNLARNRLLDLAGRFATDIDGIIYEPGDVLYIQLPGRSWGGRLAAVDSGADTVTLDQDVRTSAGACLIVQVRDSVTGGQAAGYRLVASLAGRVVSFAGAWIFPAGVTAAAAADDAYLFGPAAILTDTFEVMEVQPQAHLQFGISVIRYAAGVYTADDEESGISIDSGVAVDPPTAGPPRPPTPAQMAALLPPGALAPPPSRGLRVSALDVTGDGDDTISWLAGSISYAGYVYPIVAGATTDKYVWFDPGAVDPLTLKTGATWPADPDIYKMFINVAGQPVALYGQQVVGEDPAGVLPLLVDGSRVAAKLGITGHAWFDAEYDNGNSGAAKTIDWHNGNKQLLTLTASCNLTFTNPDGAANLVLRLIQGGAGGYTLTLPPSTYIVGGTALTLSAAVGAEDILTLYYPGGGKGYRVVAAASQQLSSSSSTSSSSSSSSESSSSSSGGA